MNLDLSKASGPDCIPVVVLKNFELELSYILAELFHKCLKESCFSDCWKVSSVVPVFKNVEERSTAKNYSPVSLLPVVSKVFEKLVNNRIVNHLEKCGLFSDFHFEWFWMEGLHKNIQSMREFHTFLMMLSVILLSMLMKLVAILSVIGHLICGNNLDWLLNLILIYEMQWAGVRSGLLTSMLGTQVVLFYRSNNNGSIDIKMGGSILEEKSSFKMLGLTISSKLDWGSYITSIAKTSSKKIGVLIRSMKFLSPEVALYLYKSTICPCIECCCHVWAGAPSCYLDLLDKLQKQICRIVGPSLAASLEPLSHRRNVASLSLFYRYYFGRCSSELVQLVPLPFSQGWSTRYSDRLHDFSVTIPRCYKDMSMSTVSSLTQLNSGILCL